MSLQPSETEIVLRLFYERHKHVFLVLLILILILTAFTFFRIRDIDKNTIITLESEKLKTNEGLLSLYDSCKGHMLETNQNYVFCCLSGERLYDCTSRTDFKQGEFMIVYAQFTKLAEYKPEYKLCRMTELHELDYPDQNASEPYGEWFCETIGNPNETKYMFVAGFVPERNPFTIIRTMVNPTDINKIMKKIYFSGPPETFLNLKGS